MTLEGLEEMYRDREEDSYYFHMQASLGTRAEGLQAYDKDGNFHCINWHDCRFCPAFNPEHCL